MNDIVERLRYTHKHGLFDANIAGMIASPDEAAAEIKRLREALDKIANSGMGVSESCKEIALAALKGQPCPTPVWASRY